MARIIAWTLMWLATSALAQTALPVQQLPAITGSNQIPLLDNRFRVDYEVKEVTLVFFRKAGAPSVVLVRPDGSKIYVSTATQNGIQWYADRTYDLIRLKEPMAGPWQALGQMLPESRIMVLTDINIKTDPLPTDLMVGEQLKVTATLANGDQPIKTKDFRDMLQMNVLLLSTRKKGMANENDTVFELATLDDDGKNFDERPRDAIFTGEFRMAFHAGEWLPKYTIKTPLYSRELIMDPITVVPTPIQIDFIEGAEGGNHQVKYVVTDGPLVPESLSIQGRIIYPGGDVQTFTRGEEKSKTRVMDVSNIGNGTYRVEQTLYGKTKSGRDVVINMAPVALRVIAAAPATAATGTEPAVANAVENAAPAVIEPLTPSAPEVEPEPEFPLGWVIFGNVLILMIGGGAAVWTLNPAAFSGVGMVFAKFNPKALLKRKSAADELDMSDPSGNSVEEPAKKSAKIKGGDDILDLSLPDD